MKKYPRDSYCLATKYFIQADPDYKKVFEEQLARPPDRPHRLLPDPRHLRHHLPAVHRLRLYRVLRRTEAAGAKFATSASPATRNRNTLLPFADYRDWDFAQIQLNYFDWFYGTAKAEYEELQKRNIPIMVMEPVRGGRLASLTPETEARLKAAHPDWSIASWGAKVGADPPAGAGHSQRHVHPLPGGGQPRHLLRPDPSLGTPTNSCWKRSAKSSTPRSGCPAPPAATAATDVR